MEDGDIIRLEHIITEKRLHSHDVRPPITDVDWQFEVTGYGYPGFEGDANDFFRVEIVESHTPKGVARERLRYDSPPYFVSSFSACSVVPLRTLINSRTIDTKFQLIHVMSGCALFSHKVKLPDWGFEQQEVTCARGATLPNTLWYCSSLYTGIDAGTSNQTLILPPLPTQRGPITRFRDFLPSFGN